MVSQSVSAQRNPFPGNSWYERLRESDRASRRYRYVSHDVGLQIIMLLILVVTAMCMMERVVGVVRTTGRVSLHETSER